MKIVIYNQIHETYTKYIHELKISKHDNTLKFQNFTTLKQNAPRHSVSLAHIIAAHEIG